MIKIYQYPILRFHFGTFLVGLLVLASNVSFAQNATGTGFFINSQGYLITNYHVIETGKAFVLTDVDRNVYDAKVINYDITNDLAILQTTQLPKKWISIANSKSVKLGDRVFTLGYPLTSLQGQSIKFTDGSISSFSGMRDQPNVFQMTVPIQPGNSGGPLINSGGSVIGVVRGKLPDLKVVRDTNQLPQNVNYAVKSNYLIELLKSSRVSFTEASSKSSNSKQLSEVSESIENAVVLINVYDSASVDNGVNAIGKHVVPDVPSLKVEPPSTSKRYQRPPDSIDAGPKQAEKIIPSSALEWNSKSVDSSNSSNWTEAIRTASAAINIDPTYDDAYVNRCRAYIGYGDLVAAKKDCDAALKLNPQNMAAKNNLAVIEFEKGNRSAAFKLYEENCKNGFELSCQNFKKYQGYSPNKPDEFVKLKLDESKKLFNDKNWNGVISVTTEIIKVAPGTSAAYTTRSGAYANLGKVNEGIADAEMAIKLNPDDAVAYNNLGYLYEMQKNKPQAVLQYEIGCGLKSELACSNLKRLK